MLAGPGAGAAGMLKGVCAPVVRRDGCIEEGSGGLVVFGVGVSCRQENLESTCDEGAGLGSWGTEIAWRNRGACCSGGNLAALCGAGVHGEGIPRVLSKGLISLKSRWSQEGE